MLTHTCVSRCWCTHGPLLMHLWSTLDVDAHCRWRYTHDTLAMMTHLSCIYDPLSNSWYIYHTFFIHSVLCCCCWGYRSWILVSCFAEMIGIWCACEPVSDDVCLLMYVMMIYTRITSQMMWCANIIIEMIVWQYNTYMMASDDVCWLIL